MIEFTSTTTHNCEIGRGVMTIQRPEDGIVDITCVTVETNGTYVAEEIQLEVSKHLTSMKILQNTSVANIREGFSQFDSYLQYELDDANSLDKFMERGEPYPHTLRDYGHYSITQCNNMLEEFVEHLEKTGCLVDVSKSR